MGNVHMEATQINYREGNKRMSVAQAIKNAGNTGLAHTADIAPEFSTESSYNAGEFVYHNGSLYEFTTNHAAGAWSTDDTQAVTVGGEITSLMSGLTNLNAVIHTATYGRTETPINIDTLGDDKPYMYLVEESSGFSGTSPTTVLGDGTTFLLIGMGNAPTQPYGWGAQIAFSFTSGNIAIRNANYNANAWNPWNIITSSTPT